MRYKFNFHQVDPSEALSLFTQEEIEKVARFLDPEGSCTVFYRMGRHECIVQFEVNSAWGHFRATGQSDDFYVSVSDAARKLGKQFHKRKERHKDHSKPGLSKQGRIERVNELLEYDSSAYFGKKVG
jgi:ribosomal subunit interface protein